MEIVIPDEFKDLYVHDAEHPVVKIPHPALRTKAVEVPKLNGKIQKIIDDMMRIMRDANGIGLAAPQIGLSQRIIVIAPGGERPLALINPVIKEMSGEEVGEEGCLSIPGLYGDVRRALSIVVEATDRKGKRYEYEMEGMPARVVQHEVDHLEGVLFTDKVDVSTLHWVRPAVRSDESE